MNDWRIMDVNLLLDEMLDITLGEITDILDYVNGIGNGRRMLNHAVHSYASRLCWSD